MMMMKSGALFFFLFALLTTVQSSSPLPFNNITIGSSIYASSSSSIQTSNSSYWLSPSGVFAFGFYPLCYNCDQYKVAIWINRPSKKVVVWSNNNEPIHSGSSIQLSHDGVFTINQPAADSTTTKPLFNHMFGRAAYALMQDTGNFVVYDSDSNIVLQSFDYPSDTLLQGQTLKPGESLVDQVTGHKLIMQKNGNLESGLPGKKIRWQSKTRNEGGGIVLSLDSTGHMYLVDKDGIVIKKLTKGKKLENQGSNGSLATTIHRATLESDGVFRLYAERIGPATYESINSVVLWVSDCEKCDERKNTLFWVEFYVGLHAAVAVLIGLLYLWDRCRRDKCLDEC